MKRLLLVLCLLLACAASASSTAQAKPHPGAAGIGDPYYPKDGNGGYDVAHYGLNIAYTPKTRILRGVATITAKATQDLSAFNLDFRGLKVRSVRVGGRSAKWRRKGGELTIVPRAYLHRGKDFVAVIAYDGTPGGVASGGFDLGDEGFIPTDDGALIAGEPHGASSWYPVNEHPRDKASYSFRISVPRGLEAVANGELQGVEHRGSRSIWRWEAKEPMASYLTTATIGQFDISTRTVDGRPYLDAIDPDLLQHVAPRTGLRYAVTGVTQPGYQRLMRTIAVPAAGAKLALWVKPDTQALSDFFFVEAHRVGSDDWTTLPDAQGHTLDFPPAGCTDALKLHPFLSHYLRDTGRVCEPKGSTGRWNAASLNTKGYERWVVDLSRYAGQSIEVALSYMTDATFQSAGVAIDDITVSGAPGSTSFEEDGDTMDGWTTPGAPVGSRPNTEDWTSATREHGPRSVGDVARAAVAKEPEVLDFLSSVFGPYPFSTAGSIIDDYTIGFALENQTRPIYSRVFFEDRGDPESDTVVVHELAHQWVGDLLSVHDWRDVWLNEGFATYAEWLWAEHEGRRTAQAAFDEQYAAIPTSSSFWRVKVADPGTKHLFDPPVYLRGGMALHALRVKIGDAAFFALVTEWIKRNAGGTVTTKRFIALAERISGQSLDGFFNTWLYATRRPPAESLVNTTFARAG